MAFGLNTLTDMFTGDPAKEAAQKQQQYIQQTQADFNRKAAESQVGGLAALKSGQTGALGALQAGTGLGRGDITGATGPAINALYGGQDLGVGALQQGRTAGQGVLQGGVGQAVSAYNPLAGAATEFGALRSQAGNVASGALGLGGPEAMGNAISAFQANPGYQFALNQGLESIVRNANAAGMPASGNMLQQSQQFGQNLANQEYEKWRQGVAQREQMYAPLESAALGNVGQGVSQAALTGGTGGANIETGTAARLADLYGQTGRLGSDVYGTAGRSLADLASRGGTAEAGIYGQTGQQSANLYSDILRQQGALAGQTLDPMGKAYTAEGQAGMEASKNLWDFGLKAATLAASGGMSGALGGLGALGTNAIAGMGAPLFATGGAGVPKQVGGSWGADMSYPVKNYGYPALA